MASFILKYEQCRKNKYDIYKVYGASQKIEPAIKEWQLVIMDFIVKLLKLKDPVIGVMYDNI